MMRFFEGWVYRGFAFLGGHSTVLKNACHKRGIAMKIFAARCLGLLYKSGDGSMNKCKEGRGSHPQRRDCGVFFTHLPRNDVVLSRINVYACLFQYPLVDGDPY